MDNSSDYISSHLVENKPQNNKDAPIINADGVQIMSTGSDVSFVFTQNIPEFSDGSLTAVTTVVGKVLMSRGTATDLSVVLTNILKSIDEDFGTIETAYMKSRRKTV